MSVTGSVLLDTSVIVPHLRGKDDLIEQRLAEQDLLFVTPTVMGELYYGAYRSVDPDKTRQGVSDFRALVEVLPIDDDVSDQYAAIKADLAKQGKPIPENDIWIAAVAMCHDLPLASRDQHFDIISKLNVLSW